MKIKSITFHLFAIAALVLCAASAQAHNDKAKAAGPNGGRILAGLTQPAEFFVTPDRKVQITFLDDHGKTIAPADQVVTVVAGDRAAPTKLTFTKSGDTLVSDVVLPEGNDVPTVVQIKPTSTAKAVTDRFNVNLSKCPTCNNAEYACVCHE